MTTDTCADACTSITFAALPALGQPLAGGTFVGVHTQPDGKHAAVIKLHEQGEGLNWAAANAWAAELGGVLPTRPVAALLFANLRGLLKPRRHWTSEAYEDDASYAWNCYFDIGSQGFNAVRFEACAVAVRLIPLAA